MQRHRQAIEHGEPRNPELSVAEVKEVIGKRPAGGVVRGQVMGDFLCQEFGLCPEDSMGGVEEF